MKNLITITLLVVMIFGTALSLVLKRHDARKHFVELQDFRKETQRLNREYGQLLLEQATWGAHGRVEELAREKLKMVVPEPVASRGAKS